MIPTTLIKREDIEIYPIRQSGAGCPTDNYGENKYVYITVENKNLEFENFIIYPYLPPSELSKRNDTFFRDLELIDYPGVKYNFSLLYVEDGKLRGLMDIEDWVPEIPNRGLDITFYVSDTDLSKSGDYLDYLDRAQAYIDSKGNNFCNLLFGARERSVLS
jgi:hypothetical protein